MYRIQIMCIFFAFITKKRLTKQTASLFYMSFCNKKIEKFLMNRIIFN